MKIGNYKQVAKGLISAALVGYCLTLVNIREVIEALSNTNLLLFSIAIAFTFAGTILCKCFVTYSLTARFSDISIRKLLAIHLSLRFYTMILPKPVVTGIRWKKYSDFTYGQMSLVLVTLEALLALLVASLAVLIFMFLDKTSNVPDNMQILASFFLFFFVCLVFMLFFYPNSKILSCLESSLYRYRFSHIAANMLSKWRETVRKLHLSNPRTLVSVLALSALGHLLFLTGGYMLLYSIHVEIDFHVLAWIRSLVFILVSVPFSIAGIGIREVSFVYLFGFYGLRPDDIIAYAFLALLVQMVIGFFGLVIELRNWFRQKHLLSIP